MLAHAPTYVVAALALSSVEPENSNDTVAEPVIGAAESPLQEPPGPNPSPESSPSPAPEVSLDSVRPRPRPATPSPFVRPRSGPEPVARPPAEAPPRAGERLPLPKYRGTGRFIAGGALAAFGFGAKLYLTIGTQPTVQGHENDIYSNVVILVAGGLVATPILGTGLALIGSGMWIRGERAAHKDVRMNTAPRFDHSTRARIGWGLLGSGLSLWLLTRILPAACRGSDRCTGAVLDGGYYPSLALVSAGVALAPFSTAYTRTRAKLAGPKNISAGVVVTPSYSGISLRGRF